MKIYKYRTLDPSDQTAFVRVVRIARERLIWCAAPSTLNDDTEFAWECDVCESPSTIDIVAALLKDVKGRPPSIAKEFARIAVRGGSFSEFGKSVIDEMIEKCRTEIGVASFGTAPDNEVLWERYGGGGSGVCIELDVPDSLLGIRLHRVLYTDHRRMHIDDFLRSRNEPTLGVAVYATLLTKTKRWEAEAEVRFLSKQPAVEVRMEDSHVSRVIMGNQVSSATADHLAHLIGAVPLVRLGSTA